MASGVRGRSNLSPERLTLLKELRQQEGLAPGTYQRIRARVERGPVPLSFAQQRLWFFDQLVPGSTAYNMPRALEIRGRLDVAALGRALTEMTLRHEALRTRFVAVDGRPMQQVAPAAPFLLPLVDLTHLSEVDREVEARRLANEEALRPFDLARDPLLRAVVLRLGEDHHVFLYTMHHIVSDGWSMGVFTRELSTLYEAFSRGKPSPLPELPIQYADFAVWQREWLRNEVLETRLAHWKERLHGMTPLQLPIDGADSAALDFEGAKQTLMLPLPLLSRLTALSRREGATLFMTLLAAFQLLLARHSGQDDVALGIPIAGRSPRETEGLIGLFLNTLVFRTNLAGHPSFRELLQRVRDVALHAYDNQDLPFEKLVEELQPERDLSRNPLFDVMFNFGGDWPTVELPGLVCEIIPRETIQSKFAMTLYVRQQEEALRLHVVYRRALFSAERIAAMLGQFRYLLEQIADSPEMPISSYSLVTPELRPLLPDPERPLPVRRYEPVTASFASWVERAGATPAVRHGQRAWTYQELSDAAHAVACALLTRGLQRGDVVAVHGSRSFGLIASMVGTLLGGGVLLPIDPNLPADRKRLMLREAGAKWLLLLGPIGTAECEEEFSTDAVVEVDPASGAPEISPTPKGKDIIKLPAIAPDEAAYIFFTSGTTGVPKGVLGTHKGLSHFLSWQQATFAVGPQDRVAQLTALSFDVVLRDVFLPLTSGATLCLPEEADERADQVVGWLERQRISLLHAVPAVAQVWLASAPAPGALCSLRYVFFAGEPLTESLVNQWRAAFPRSSAIVNLYGPTETTLAKCFYLVPAEAVPGVQLVGSPLPETQALVLTGDHTLCGIGEAGEIAIRTPFGTLGYINAPEEQRRRFVSNPFTGEAHDLLYFTGDRGRYRPDGTLEILGRLDDQVKIRGVRVEPSEVASVLSRHASVASCAVVAFKDMEGQNFLAAYVVAARGCLTSATQLRSYLAKQLPPPLVPSAFVMMDALPLSTNGKVDRGALPKPAAMPTGAGKSFVAPRTATEAALARIWAQVLGIDQVGIHDNFFELGGHSLRATQVVSRIGDAFSVKVALRSVFETESLAELAEQIDALIWVRQGRQSVPSHVADREEMRL